MNKVGDNCITIKGLYKSFHNKAGKIDVLKGIDINFNIGETISIVGESGIGKSTFLNIIGTLDRPDKGKISFLKKDVFSLKDDELAKFRNKSIGFIFQFHYLLPEFNALENVMIPLIINGYKKKIASEKAQMYLEKVGLKHRLQHRSGELSGGEQQRVAVARAIVNEPYLLLADEPTGNLDIKNSNKVHELLMELKQDFNMTMIVVTHNMELANFMNRRLTLIDGKIVE